MKPIAYGKKVILKVLTSFGQSEDGMKSPCAVNLHNVVTVGNSGEKTCSSA